MTVMWKVGLVGCGTIGTRIARALDEGEIQGMLVAVHDLDRERVLALVKGMKHQTPVQVSFDEVFTMADLVVEAASQGVVPRIIENAIRYRKDCMLMSVGGLLGAGELIGEAQRSGIRIYCPSGALAGLDAVAAASIGRIDAVRLTTRKPPDAFRDAPYIRERGIDLGALMEETVIFEGTALDAVPAFPKNINVAATLSLAGVGPERTMVRIVADPAATRNSHEIEVEGEFGKLVARTENLPAPFTPGTSYLAALSAVACLKKITGVLKIGG